MSKVTVAVPDIGGAENVDVIEISVAIGDTVTVDQDLIVLETDKASMEVPCPQAGTVVELLVSVGDKINEGDAILVLETAAVESAPAEAPAAPAAIAEPAVASAAVPAAAASTASQRIELTIPDLGGADEVTLIELCVEPGTEVASEDSLLVLETDKASMDVPAPEAGKIIEFKVSVDDKVKEGDVYAVMEVAGAAAPASTAVAEPAASAPVAAVAPVAAPAAPAAEIELALPDLGGADGVTVIELCVAPGTAVSAEDSLIVLETDKASMDVPAPEDGILVGFKVKEGDTVSEGDLYAVFKPAAASDAVTPAAVAPAPAAPAPVAAAPVAPVAAPAVSPVSENGAVAVEEETVSNDIYAGPSSRRLARQLGVDLTKVKGTGIRGRITKDDIRSYVKNALQRTEQAPAAKAVTGGAGIPAIPAVDFSQFGDIDMVKLSKIKKVTAANMSRAWLNVPHVTQFDEADITDLEAFRKSMKAEAEKAGIKLTPMPFLIKAVAMALRAEPSFNVSLHHDGEHMVHKNYVHIGIACDTPNGLMVPVLRDADKKGIYQIAREANELIKAARDGKLKPRDMQGGCFTISSLGAMGGTAFTPIVNAPEVAILGVSKAQMKPVWNGQEFVPRNMLPLAVSYDHRAINGADCGRFFTTLVAMIADIRRVLL
ncbi:pyruvate dehydrogenase complex dihydrolipoyllysine-residue acetyltransferase [Oceanobacter sp. 4_MG-2023]|uniref:pyruvate dehydrogenase complex dihydrolipoyllysine-residue acetyltransferase n=1 Tax=Oceanobacter sp. 4_MG-2023 TaxID=3062623 RepID=UPI0027346D18|nr:pyruvate dehydrogenase complex dihydrolipoyllysine-residue acetyltransferase [Oceanobacter sp. 4_MG-2023]MDP2547272.1 pyruvate dehydrogenase complex dihydrolipoyllysine-residue acetyltransferase [Oceanobacter sp. 4_MG-2023]